MRREGLRISIEYCRVFDIMGVFWMETTRGICRRSQFLREECACQLWIALVNIRGSSADLPACFFGTAYSGIWGEFVNSGNLGGFTSQS